MESILIFCILSSIILINLLIVNNINNKSLYKKEDVILKTQISNAKQIAVLSKNIVNINFYKNILTIIVNNTKTEYKFNNIYFQNNKELYFNKNGVINQGYTILYKNGYSYHKIIFYIGKGWFKIE